jgi:NADPH:quinone reductase-like Zn-dependent oxidoreductase
VKAAVIGALGAVPYPAAYPDPPPAGSQLLARVEAAALNTVDLHVPAGASPTSGPRQHSTSLEREAGADLLVHRH